MAFFNTKITPSISIKKRYLLFVAFAYVMFTFEFLYDHHDEVPEKLN